MMQPPISDPDTAGWDEGTKNYIKFLKDESRGTNHPYSLRYVGTLVSDFHRTLIKGGIFLYPAYPKAKLRLLYEASPMAIIAEQAGGVATDGTRRILEISPKELHQKVGLVVGSKEDMKEFLAGL